MTLRVNETRVGPNGLPGPLTGLAAGVDELAACGRATHGAESCTSRILAYSRIADAN